MTNLIPKTARSQAIGGIIWGVGQALLEQSETDPASGQFINRNYSGYLVPTNADIPELDVLFVGGFVCADRNDDGMDCSDAEGATAKTHLRSNRSLRCRETDFLKAETKSSKGLRRFKNAVAETESR